MSYFIIYGKHCILSMRWNFSRQWTALALLLRLLSEKHETHIHTQKNKKVKQKTDKKHQKQKSPKTLKIYKALTKAFHVFGIAQISHLILVSFALEKMK